MYSKQISMQVISEGLQKYSFIHSSIGLKNSMAFSGINRPVILIIPFGSRMTSGVLLVGDNIF
jgi:hypothetical protein